MRVDYTGQIYTLVKCVCLTLSEGCTPRSGVRLDKLPSFYRLSRETFSDHGSNFVGASLKTPQGAVKFLRQQESQEVISNFSGQNTEWDFIPERVPHFGGLLHARPLLITASLEHHFHIVGGRNVISHARACCSDKPEPVQFITPRRRAWLHLQHRRDAS